MATSENRLVKVDLLDYLFSNIGVFNQLDPVGKKRIFNSRPQPTLKHVLDVVKDKRFLTAFNPKYYSMFPWMTACPKRQVLFCYVCLLQGKTVESVLCSRDDIQAAAHAHELTMSHMESHDNCLQAVFSPKDLTANDQNDVYRKRAVLLKIAQTLFLLKCHNYSEKLENDHLSVQKTVDFLALNDVNFSLDWKTYFPTLMTNKTQQSSLFAHLRAIVVEYIKSELAQSDFVSMQMEDVSEYIFQPTISVSFRFVLNNQIYERFGGFYELVDYGAKIDGETLVEILNFWDIRNKIVGISADFHADRLPILVPNRPFVLFNLSSVYYDMCYVIVKIASVHKEIRSFLGNLNKVTSFFESPAVESMCKAIKATGGGPGILSGANAVKNLNSSRSINSQIFSAYSHGKELCGFLTASKKLSFIAQHLSSIESTEKVLRDPNFAFLGSLFWKMFKIGAEMEKVLGSFANSEMSKVAALTKFKELTAALGSEDKIDQNSSESKYLNHNIVAAVLKDFDFRDKNQSGFAIGRLFWHNENRGNPTENFAVIKSTLESVLTETKGLLDFNLPRLKLELHSIFKDSTKSKPAGQLFETMVANGTHAVYPEFMKLLRFFLTFPTSKTTSTNESTYLRIKSFARVTRGLGDLHDIDFLLIEKDLTLKVLGDHDCTRCLIDTFAKAEGLNDLLLDRSP